MITAWTSSESTSRSDRPSSRASRLIGVTRERSMTPARSSAMRPNPWNRPPKMASSTSSPGTKMRYAAAFVVAPSGISACLSSGANSSRCISGWKMPTKYQTGLRTSSKTWRWKMSQMSRRSFVKPASDTGFAVMVVPLAFPQRAAGLLQEHVVQAGPVQLDRAQMHPGAVERAQDQRDRGGTGVHVEAHPAALGGLDLVDVGLPVEQPHRVLGGPVQADRHDLAGDLPLELAGCPFGDDQSI